MSRLGSVNVRAQAVSVWTARVGECVAIVPLTVEVVCHVDDVVYHNAYGVNGEALEVPARSGSRNGQRNPSWESHFEVCKEQEIIHAIIWASGRDSRDIWCPQILPIEVNPVQAVLLDICNYTCDERVAVFSCNSFAENGI